MNEQDLAKAVQVAKAVSEWVVYVAEDGENAIRKRTADELMFAQVQAAAEVVEVLTRRRIADEITLDDGEDFCCSCPHDEKIYAAIALGKRS